MTTPRAASPPACVLRRLGTGGVEVRDTAAGRRVSFFASTDAPDRYDDIVDQRSWRLDAYRANPVVQVDHDYSVQATVARGSVEVRDTRGRPALMLDIEVWADTPRAVEVRGQVEARIVSAVSVGFRPGRSVRRSELPADHPYYGQSGMVYYDCELLEVSIVAVPANPEALAAGLPGLAGGGGATTHHTTSGVTSALTAEEVLDLLALALATDTEYRRRVRDALHTPDPLPWMAR